MNRNLTLCALTALSLAGFSLAEAQEGKPRPGAFFQQMDKNGDGQISKDEAPAQAWENFLSKRDTNNDGVVSKEELSAGGPGAPGGSGAPGGPGGPDRMFQALDTDSDGKITQAEAGERWERLSQMDKNADGAITKDELPAFGGPGGPGGGRFNPAEMIGRLDTDGDGKITQAEAGERWERLSQMDKNADGAITKDELPAFGGPGGPGGGRFNPAEMIGRLDTDGDGKVSQAEAGERWERLSQMDKNADGAITKDELPAFGGPGGPGGPGGKRPDPAEMFSRMDKDGNGQLTSSEVPAELWEKISKADADGNGSVTKEELSAARPRPGGPAPQGKPEAGKEPQRPPVES